MSDHQSSLGKWCTCAACTRERIIRAENASKSIQFDRAMADVKALREARAREIERRDRTEWDCFFHFACQNSLLKRQAD
jgi:hypothetical protein